MAQVRVPRKPVHRWRDYQTASGRRPIKEFLDALDDEDLASVVAAMKQVRQQGLQAARHLEGEIYEGSQEEDPEDVTEDHSPR